MSIIGSLRVIMGIDTAAYESGLRRAEGRTRQSQRTIMGSFAQMRTAAAGLVGVIGVGVLAAQAREAFDYAASLGEASRAIGLTAEQYQILNRAALENGFSMEQAERGMGFFLRRLGEAQAGLPAAVRAFRQIGITPEQLRSFPNAAEALRAVMEALRNLNTTQARTAAGNALFSRSFRVMSNFLNQGAAGYDEVAEAARAAGLVTDEQARRADDASDRLAILGHTLRTNLASALVDIMPLIEAVVGGLAGIARAAMRAVAGIGNFVLAANANRGPLAITSAMLALGAGGSQRQSFWGSGSGAPPTGDVDLDLSGGGGGGGRRRGGGGGANNAAREAERAAREAAQHQTELRRHRIDALREMERLAVDFVEQDDIRKQILDLEREEYQARLTLDVQLREQTQAQADAALAAFDGADALRRRNLVVEALGRAEEERRELAELDHDQTAERLRLEADAATTAGERRQAELRLLDLTYQHEVAKRDAILADERAGFAAQERARRERDGLVSNHGRQRDQVMRSTMGPMEQFLADLPTTAARANEALQQVATDGLRSLTDGLVDAITGAKSLADAFSNMAKSIIADLLRIMIQQQVIAPLAQGLSGLLGGGAGALTPKVAGGFAGASGIKGFATGGSFRVGGMAGIDRNLLSINGVPAARVSSGERVSVSPGGAGGGVIVNQHFSIEAGNAATRQDVMQLAAMVKPMAREAYADMARRR